MNRCFRRARSLALLILLGTAFAGATPAQTQEPAKGTTDVLYLGGLIEAQDRATAQFLTRDLVIADLSQGTDDLLGARLKPVDDVLRAQLAIAAKQGLLVEWLKPDGPSAQAGLHQNDILLWLADKPLSNADDLTAQLQAAGKSTVPLKVLRAGKPVTIQVRALYRVTFAAAPDPKTEYFIGVSLDPVDNAVRTQLGLPAGQGVVISDVIKGSPAEKAGVKKFDIAVGLGDKVVGTPDALAHQVQVSRDAPTVLKLLRGGKNLNISLAADVRKVDSEAQEKAARLALADLEMAIDQQQRLAYAQKPSMNVEQRVERMEKELKALHDAVDRLNETLKKAKRE